MPTYDYRCFNCMHTEEVSQKITEPSLTECPKCHQKTWHRGPGGGIGLQFQGSGFYATDYGSKPQTKPSSKKEPSSGGGCCPCGKGSSCDNS